MSKTNKLYAQYTNKTKLEAWADLPKFFTDELVNAANDVRDSYDIDNNNGVQLDVIGNVVVEDRSYIQSLTFTVYECNSDGDNECGDDEVQLSATSGTDDSDLSDDYFRYLLKSKIQKNNCDASIDEILTAITTIAPDIDVMRLTDGEDMTFSIEFYGEADAITRDLLISADVVPTPQGVKFNGFLEGYDIIECGDTTAECNADGDNECVGFIGV